MYVDLDLLYFMSIMFDALISLQFLGNSDKIGKKKKYRPRIIQKNVEKDLDYLSDISYEDDDGSIKALSAEKLSNKVLVCFNDPIHVLFSNS